MICGVSTDDIATACGVLALMIFAFGFGMMVRP